MKVFLGADRAGLELKNQVKQYLAAEMKDIEVIDLTPNGAEDFIDSTLLVTENIKRTEGAVGLLFDETGAGSFMAATKINGIVAAEVSDEHSAKMTRDHNNASVLAIGSKIVGEKLAEGIVKAFLSTQYSGGRHQVRVDMLEAMC